MAALHYLDGIDAISEARCNDTTVIVDRFHVGELVYGPLLRGGSGITMDEATVIDMKLEGMGVTLVHCTLKYDEMVRRLITRDGGVPDEKSGATVAHSHSIRASFIHKCGRPGRKGVLPAKWEYLEMTGYPEQMARFVLTRSNLTSIVGQEGIYGCPFVGDAAILLPKDEEMEYLTKLASILRELGKLKRVRLITNLAISGGVTLDSEDEKVIVLGDAVDWVVEQGIEYDYHLEVHDDTLKSALATCLMAG